MWVVLGIIEIVYIFYNLKSSWEINNISGNYRFIRYLEFLNVKNIYLINIYCDVIKLWLDIWYNLEKYVFNISLI